MPKQKFNVYLAGPISGCNDTQIHQWRDEVKSKFAKDMNFIDPSEMRRGTPYKIVQADIESIEEADGVLANMWRESIGTAIGVVHAHRHNKPVVVADPSHLHNSTLKFYATAIEEKPLKAAKTLQSLLRADAGWRVIKTNGDKEDFSRKKLVSTLRAVARSTRRDHILLPVVIMPEIIERLGGNSQATNKELSTKDINRAVLESLAELEKSDDYASLVRGISGKWKAKRDSDHKTKPPQSQPIVARQVHVPMIIGKKAHGTIWGNRVEKIDDVPGEAKQVFKTICQVEGITSIALRKFGRDKRKSFICATVSESNDPFIIEGILFDNQRKGTMQTFQVSVQHSDRKHDILKEIIEELKEAEYWGNP